MSKDDYFNGDDYVTVDVGIKEENDIAVDKNR